MRQTAHVRRFMSKDLVHRASWQRVKVEHY